VLDAGCGNGAFVESLVDRGYPAVGFDVSRMGIEIAERRNLNAEFHQRSIYDEMPADWLGRFDVVVSLEVIEHLYSPRELLRLAREALKPSGILLLSTPFHGYIKNVALAVTGRMDTHFTALWDNGHIKFFSKRTLGELVASEGFSDLSWTFCGRFPFLWKSMVVTARAK
jgi:2-polyprenyl-3-methyl-5-hydroxy-6-metoxy-1,4-benzoquinol methylase